MVSSAGRVILHIRYDLEDLKIYLRAWGPDGDPTIVLSFGRRTVFFSPEICGLE